MDVVAHAPTAARDRLDAVSAWADIPWYLLALCFGLIAAVIVGYAFAFRDIRRDLRKSPP